MLAALYSTALSQKIEVWKSRKDCIQYSQNLESSQAATGTIYSLEVDLGEVVTTIIVSCTGH